MTASRFSPNASICARCLLTTTFRPARHFSNTLAPQKKSSSNPKSACKTPTIDSPSVDRHVPDNAATRNRDAEPDPYDHSALQSGIDKAIARLQVALTKTRDAGRVSAEMLEALPVELNVKGADTQGKPAHKEAVRLGDIASVVPKGGRAMQIFAAEEAHVKPLVAAVQASPYSLAPESPTPASNANADSNSNPLCITVPVPPVTAETRQQAVAEAKKCLERAQLDVRNARGDAQKRHKTMEKNKVVVVDELRKAHKGMEEVAKKGAEEVKRIHDAAVRALGQ
jgi:ribosome recycling factor